MTEPPEPEPQTPDSEPVTPEASGAQSRKPPGSTSGIKAGMSEREIRDAGLAIDVPFETGDGRERLKYADLGPDKKWTPPAAEKETPSPTPTPEEESS